MSCVQILLAHNKQTVQCPNIQSNGTQMIYYIRNMYKRITLHYATRSHDSPQNNWRILPGKSERRWHLKQSRFLQHPSGVSGGVQMYQERFKHFYYCRRVFFFTAYMCMCHWWTSRSEDRSDGGGVRLSCVFSIYSVTHRTYSTYYSNGQVIGT